jgi:hypothetical protein
MRIKLLQLGYKYRVFLPHSSITGWVSMADFVRLRHARHVREIALKVKEALNEMFERPDIGKAWPSSARANTWVVPAQGHRALGQGDPRCGH